MSPLQARSIGAYDEAAAFPLPDDRAHPARIVPPALLADLLSTGHLEMRRLHGRILTLTDPPDARGWLEGLLSGDDPLAIDLDDDALGSDLGRLLLTGAP
jgi:hypothetical protein